MNIDLHSHSTCSDGTYSPKELLELAHRANIQTFALTDHDTILGLKEAHQSAKVLGIRLINGVEISCKHNLTGGYGKNQAVTKSIHVVALDFYDSEKLQNRLSVLQNSRENRGWQIVQKLAEILALNPDILWQKVLVKACHNPKAVGRAHIAQVLYEIGQVKTVQEAFDKFLADNKPAYVSIDAIGMQEAIGLIHQCGGYAVLAHPTRYNLSATRVRKLIAEFASFGGDAVELPNPTEPISTRAMIDRCIDGHKLMVSVGSDFHGTNMPWRKLAQVASLKANQIGIWTCFRGDAVSSIIR
ncbi:MAG: PHP domain-containing protein [Moraxella sp.]